jgi:hypothetical protein
VVVTKGELSSLSAAAESKSATASSATTPDVGVHAVVDLSSSLFLVLAADLEDDLLWESSIFFKLAPRVALLRGGMVDG